MGQPRVGHHPGLMTDLYHPDAAYVSWRAGKNGPTTFDLYTRTAPFGGVYLLVAGLEMALDFVQAFRYTDEELKYLATIRDYEPGFLAELSRLRFSGEILAMPEGTIAFPNEPLLRVTAPFREALLLESGLLQALNLATLIATKAARVVWAAQGRRVAEFGFRRAQEPYTVARSAYIGGCWSTSFVAAAYEFRIPATGTIPHALVQLFETEQQAFEAVAQSFNRYTLLLDTYEPRRAIHTAVEVARKYKDHLGHTLVGVRLDSGDLLGDSQYVRQVLREAGLDDVKVLGSGDLDEFKIAHLLAEGAQIDSFGVGTTIGVGAGSVEAGVEGGALGGVYKEVLHVDERGLEHPTVKVAAEKSTWPGKKEVYRVGGFEQDVIQLASEPKPPNSQRLLKPVMLNGELVPGALPPLSEIRELAEHNLKQLPERYHALIARDPYPVRFSPRLRALRDRLVAEQEREGPPAPRSRTERDAERGNGREPTRVMSDE
ncbi:MAG: nicotinate phosphoribosyltransferase [Chloroflexi bacterium]|nr:nicotinate phosphoribosyltransferase [Chloroflexota bacterium]